MGVSKAEAGLFTTVYSLARKSGVLSTRVGQDLFTHAYNTYKKYLEDPFYALARKRPDLFRGGYVLDVGANIGYTSTVFAQAIDPQFRVYAFEPEPFNFQLLGRAAAAKKARGRIIAVQAAVGESDGTVPLWRNDHHHGDHRVRTATLAEHTPAEESFSVPLVSIDTFVARTKRLHPVCFIKVDVQGYELAVCHGMQKTLSDNPEAALVLEFMPEAMEDLGFHAADFLQWVKDGGFQIQTLEKSGDLTEGISPAIEKTGYVDLLLSRGVIRSGAEPRP